MECTKCGKVFRYDPEITLHGLCPTCRRDRLLACEADMALGKQAAGVLERDQPEAYLLGFDNVPRDILECRGCGATASCVEPFHALGSLYSGLCRQCVKFKAAQSNAPKLSHSYVLASFENGVRFQHDLQPPEETGLWTWTCSACGLTEQTISQFAPPADPRTCPGRAPARRKLSERMRSLLGSREISAEKKWRFENLLCWMDRYQEEDFPIPPHWVSEALEIMAEGRAK